MTLNDNKIEIEGRSLLLNILAVLLNIAGVYFIAKGFHVSSGESSTYYNLIGFVCFVLGLMGLVALKGMYMFSFVSRAFVGGLFVVSGLVKANDPWGFAFKLEEYFSPTGLAYDFPFFTFFEDYTLQLSILISVVEIVLGVAVIVGGKIKLTSWLLVLMMLFFSWLTYYTYSCVEANELMRSLGQDTIRDCVTDCGCFGDALRGSVGRSLSPYESFWKDLILFYFVIIIFINQRKISINTYKQNWVMVLGAMLVVMFFSWVFGWYFPVIFFVISMLGAFVIGNMNIGKIEKPWKMAIYVTIISFFFSLYTTLYLPVKDYRPYRIGNDIQKEMNKGYAAVYDYLLEYENKQTGEKQRFKVSDYEVYGDTTKWKFVDRFETLITAGEDSPIADFVLTVDYDKIPEDQKSNVVLDSIISEEYENFYEEKLVTESEMYGIDTINKYDYLPYMFEPELSEDTIFFNKKESFIGLIDPTSRYRVDVTTYILSLDRVILLTIRDIEHINEASIEDLKGVYEGALAEGIPFYIITPANDDQIAAFNTKFEFNAPVLAIDGTEVKIIVRSNPGLIILENAKVIDKWGSRSVPSFDVLLEKLK